ncbi:hypothetical protein [Acetobacter nitrogenifigens]|uniref:Polysaccharide biosynthesis protein C-terminal domain-containing protein n=1 Tax=Acetobacter nitrogenifigens DSM 23921 = NBRC 105050 TaxID=1120919 RepID=A0A511XEB6_9PROT|nr:hypothetical protein [Acetobacter nitrogenifigens]GEN61289.1 hypothetical protein ANI02nite_31730 [Acetobacter nitrogenifigens DSM 23921 = NBRC 105050]
MWFYILGLMLVNIFLGIEGAWLTALSLNIAGQVAVAIFIGRSCRDDYTSS